MSCDRRKMNVEKRFFLNRILKSPLAIKVTKENHYTADVSEFVVLTF